MTVFIHIGVPKSGTTTLQSHVFPKHPGIDFRSWPSEMEMPELYKVLYSEQQYITREIIDTGRDEVTKAFRDGDKPILLSREHLTHEIFDKGLIAERLQMMFGQFKVIITIREQRSMLESAYLWKLRTIRKPWASGLPPRTFDEYIAGQFSGLRSIKRKVRLSTGDYASIIRKYIDLVGRENIGVFLFEEMVAAPRRFCEKLFSFIGVDQEIGYRLLAGKRENIRLARRQYIYWAGLAYFVPLPLNRAIQAVMPDRILSFVARGRRMSVALSAHWQSAIASYYAPGNQYLAREFNLPLREYGYVLED